MWAPNGCSRRDLRERSMFEAHPGDHRRQPAAEVLDAARVAAGEPEPRLLHCVVGFAERPEHSVCHRPQVAAVRLEAFGQQVEVGHPSATERMNAPSSSAMSWGSSNARK